MPNGGILCAAVWTTRYTAGHGDYDLPEGLPLFLFVGRHDVVQGYA